MQYNTIHNKLGHRGIGVCAVFMSSWPKDDQELYCEDSKLAALE